jgi:hypothetical protein
MGRLLFFDVVSWKRASAGGVLPKLALQAAILVKTMRPARICEREAKHQRCRSPIPAALGTKPAPSLHLRTGFADHSSANAVKSLIFGLWRIVAAVLRNSYVLACRYADALFSENGRGRFSRV